MGSRIKRLIAGNEAVLIVILLSVVLSMTSDVFFTQRNLLNVLRQVCVTTILASGFAMVLGSGHIDLSVGSVVGLTGIFMAQMMVRGYPVWLALILGIIIGSCFGMVNAFFITAFSLPPYIVTMAMQQVLRGLCYLVTGYIPVTGIPDKFNQIGQGYWGTIPIPVYIMLAVVLLLWTVVNRTKFGRYIIAMGGNAEAARVSGINIVAVRFGTYATMGAAAGLAAAVLTARAASAQVTGGLNMEMDAIAAVVIGGTNMRGGKINMLGAFFGCLLVGIVNNGLNLLGIDSAWQIVAKGGLILFAVCVDQVTNRILEKNKVVKR